MIGEDEGLKQNTKTVSIKQWRVKEA